MQVNGGGRMAGPAISRREAIRALAAVPLLATAARAGHAEDPGKALIEFGWDEPDTAFMRREIGAMAETPFDGCVFHANFQGTEGDSASFAWECFGRRAFNEGELLGAIEDLAATDFGRFRQNFLRVNTTPADLDWFDDFRPVLANCRLAARITREGACRGLLFDTEPYEGKLFDYREQRDAGSKPWDSYADQARLRGREVMEAFQQGRPDLTILLTFGYTYPWKQSEQGRIPLAECNDGLLAPFLDGMVEVAGPEVRIVDGYELSYSYRQPAQFADARRTILEGVRPIVDDPDAYHRAVTAGFGLWMDYQWRDRGWSTDDIAGNYFTPEVLEASVRAALDQADEFVWIYTEQPRWWTPDGGSSALPDAYDAAIRRARSS